MSPSLEFRSGSVSGVLGGKVLNCMVHPSMPGSTPPAGLYQILPPVEDAVFGQLAVMTPVGMSAGTASRCDKGIIVGSSAPSLQRQGGASAKAIEWKWGGGASAKAKEIGPSVGASVSLFDKFVGGRGGSTSFILSSRPMPGRNCLVIANNFADFMDALTATGGATVRFS